MTKTLTFRSMTALAAAGLIGFATLGMAAGEPDAPVGDAVFPADRQMTIWRDPSCGCCDAYAEYMEKEGYHVTRIDDRDFDKRSIEVGVPEQGLGCHLAEIDGYYVSGLVPADIIQRLTTERPKITGITLPGMPQNAPGMAGKSGTLKTYAFGEDGISVYADE
ncbi:DUF411 domain-containing protein [Puniceibacterium confluentis]|uniref:DUF411 domain-containing protein n=1 Tax=Puniceibacterium confluentis TaxID=1958944 RepID=UPI0011B8340E|nr:DUF411 domain-containing protein [Puniceibacterium confluentis]